MTKAFESKIVLGIFMFLNKLLLTQYIYGKFWIQTVEKY